MSTPAPTVAATLPATPAAAPSTAPAAAKSPLPAPKVLLQGDSGTGKTFCIGTLVDYLLPRGGEVAFVATEQGYEALFGYWTDRGLPIPPNLYVQEVKGPDVSFATQAEYAKMVNALHFDALCKYQDPNKYKYDQFVKLLEAFNNFTDDRSGKKLGAFDTWGTNRWLVLDGLSGASNCAMNLFVGGRVAVSPSDWGVGQKNLESLLRKSSNVRAGFVLISHVEREQMADGSSKMTVSTLGKALAPKLPGMFSDVIQCKRQQGTGGMIWLWDTADSGSALKTRNLPYKPDIKPDFAEIVKKWESRGGVIAP